MLEMEDKPAGANFEEWLDILHDTPDGCWIKNFRRDGFNSADEFYLEMELATRSAMNPIVKRARGVGNWVRPKVVMVTYEITAGKLSRGSPKWDGLRKYRRLRPFCVPEWRRGSLYGLLRSADLQAHEIYLCVANKKWLEEDVSIATLREEMAMLGAPIVCEDVETFNYVKKYGTGKAVLLPVRKDHMERKQIFRSLLKL